ncbi:hypothetical protein D9601_10335 [Sphingomonas sp. MA1305]|uniref:hypothetical protein n=1 Tax=Sphingomonas sp. MA1305 TaxID=2479204 RepID=UPI0018DF0DBA|nr:hypothetical protein [Sphingomonas sp. MA1305]MBI0475749.1 hypothetical protein [Sphingomonas sp. MA1305]
MTQPVERTVTIAATANGFGVIVSPDDEAAPYSKDYASYPEARGYARGLKLYKGWTLTDMTGGGNG